MENEQTKTQTTRAHVMGLFGRSDKTSARAWVMRLLPGRSAGTLKRTNNARNTTGPTGALQSAWATHQPAGDRVFCAANAVFEADEAYWNDQDWQADPTEVRQLQTELARELRRRATSEAARSTG